MSERVMDVLLVEDDPGDALMVREALEGSAMRCELSVAVEGVEALSYLRKEVPFENAVTPDLVLLDLNMPRMGGREVLREIKSDATLRTIPVVVLTTSGAPQDVRESYERHANAYVTKPVDFEAFADVVQRVEHFYSELAQRPRG